MSVYARDIYKKQDRWLFLWWQCWVGGTKMTLVVGEGSHVGEQRDENKDGVLIAASA